MVNRVKDIDAFFPSFIKKLNRERKEISLLLLTGKLEDYLLKRFLLHIYSETREAISSYANMGSKKKKEGLVDLCIFDDRDIVYSIIEAKHIENVRRDYKVGGEIKPLLRKLSNQVHPFGKKTIGDHTVELRSENNSIYGLVFCCFKGYKNEDYEKKKEKFFRRILEDEFTEDFKSPGKSKAELETAYEDCKVRFGSNDKCYVTLKVGLWVKKNG